MCQNNCNDYSLRTANTGLAVISVANSNLDGTSGIVTTVFTAGLSGAVIKSVTIKAQAPVTTGMVRLFVKNVTTALYKEVTIPVTPSLVSTPTPTPVLPLFETTLIGDLELQSGCSLLATTQVGDAFSIVVEGYNWDYPGTLPSTCCNFKQVTAITGVNVVSVANSFTNGNGTIVRIFTAPSAVSSNGSFVKNVTIKAMGSTGINGAIRLFIGNGGGAYQLIREVMVPQTTQSAYEPSWKQVVELGLHLQPDYVLGASTQNAESFAITVEGEEWSYPI